MGTFVETIRDARAKREAARQYVLAADAHRAVARACRDADCPDAAAQRERLAETLMRNAAWEVTA